MGLSLVPGTMLCSCSEGPPLEEGRIECVVVAVVSCFPEWPRGFEHQRRREGVCWNSEGPSSLACALSFAHPFPA